MKFVQISEDAFRKFAVTSPYQSFMQTPEIAEFRAKSGWHPYFFAVTADERSTSKTSRSPNPSKSSKSSRSLESALEVQTFQKNYKRPHKKPNSTPKILAASLVLAKPTFFGYQTFYAPGGPLLDFEDKKLTDFFFTHLAEFAKSHRAYVLRIDPYYELKQRDRDGRIVASGFNHESAKQNLTSRGFKTTDDTTMPQYLFALDFATDINLPPPPILCHQFHPTRIIQ